MGSQRQRLGRPAVVARARAVSRIRFESQSVVVGDGASGIRVSYTKSRRALELSGWFDHFVGIEGGEVGLAEFLSALGVSDRDLRAVLRERSQPHDASS